MESEDMQVGMPDDLLCVRIAGDITLRLYHDPDGTYVVVKNGSRIAECAVMGDAYNVLYRELFDGYCRVSAGEGGL